MRKLLAILALGFLVATPYGCRNKASHVSKPVITVSIEPQRWLLERIVGDKMEVRSLMARGGNPESYEPTFSHLSDLERSRAYLCVGNLGLETAIVDKVMANNPELPVINTSDSIMYIRDVHHRHPGHDTGVDPHVWSSAGNARIMAENMLRIVSELDPDNARTYTANFISLSETIDSVDAACDSIMSTMENRAFVVWHPSLSYFARDYGLQQIVLGAEGKEHSVSDTRDVIDRMARTGADVILVQKDFDSSQAEVISKKDGAAIRVETINPLEYEWDKELIRTAHAIAGR